MFTACFRNTFWVGHGFSRAAMDQQKCGLYRVLKNSILFLLLGGAAVHRCDNRLVFSDGFSR
jgi:hypothetical protein